MPVISSPKTEVLTHKMFSEGIMHSFSTIFRLTVLIGSVTKSTGNASVRTWQQHDERGTINY